MGSIAEGRGLRARDIAYETCPSCAYRRYVLGEDDGGGDGKISSEVKSLFAGKRTEDIDLGLPPGSFSAQGMRPKSEPALHARGMAVPVTCQIKPYIKCDDGSYCLVMYRKNPPPDDDSEVSSVSLQATAAAYAVETNVLKRKQIPVAAMACIWFAASGVGSLMTLSEVQVATLSRESKRFQDRLEWFTQVLDSPKPPLPDAGCGRCN